MAIQDLMTGDNALMGAAGIGSIAWLVRMAMTMFSKQALEQTGANSQREHIDRLEAEAKKWEARYDASEKNHTEAHNQYLATLALLNEMRSQNKMLRMLLIQRGMSAEDLDKALEIDDVA